MTNKQGDFIWYELLSSDADAAQKFYADIFGWQFADSGHPDIDYRTLSATSDDGTVNGVGGLLQITEDMKAGGARPVWLGYISVEDVDTAVNAIVTAGGKVFMPATDIPDVGRIAMVADPQGAPFYVMDPTGDPGTSLAFAYDKPRIGHCAWNELSTSDPKAALKFYGDQFGWTKDGEMDLGPMGAYEFLRHGGMIGALMPKPPALPVSMWNFYFRVADIDAAAAKITANGGKIVHGPDEIPGGDFSIKAIDPQGAIFAAVGART